MSSTGVMPQGNSTPKPDDKSELDLRAIIDANPRLDELSAARVVCQVATSVHAAKGGATELSPEAIAIKSDGSIHVELGKLVLAYASPEKIKNLATDRRSDVFSLGVVLWEALTHVRLFEGGSDDAIGKAVTSDEIMAPSQLNANVPAELDTICKKALARDPAERYQSVKVMAAELEAVLDDAEYPDDNSRLAAFVQKALAQKPKLPAPKVAPKIPTTPPQNVALPSILARPNGTSPPPITAASTLPGMPPVRPATIPPVSVAPVAPIAPVLPVAPEPAPVAPIAPVLPIAVVAEPPVAPSVPAPPILPSGSGQNLRSTIIGTPAPPGLDELVKTTPFVREETPPPAIGLIAGLGAMPGLAAEAPKPPIVPIAPVIAPPTPVAAPIAAPAVEVAAAAPAPALADEPPTDELDDDAAKNPADVVALGRPSQQDMLSRWAWQTDSMEAIHDEPEDTAPNRKTLLYAIGGALGVALLIIIIAVASGGSKKEEVVADKPAEFKPTVSAGTEPTPTPTPTPEVKATVVDPVPPTPTPPPTPEVKAVAPPVDAMVAIAPPPPPIPTPKPPEIKKAEPPPHPPEVKKAEIKKAPEVKKAPEIKKAPKKVATGPVDPYGEQPKKVDPAEAYRTGLQQYMRGDTNGALATFKASMAANSGYAPTYRGLGLVYEKLGNHSMARAAFKRYLALAPSASDAENIRERMEKL